MIKHRLAVQREADAILPLRAYYRFTTNLDEIWSIQTSLQWGREMQLALFESKTDYGSL